MGTASAPIEVGGSGVIVVNVPLWDARTTALPPASARMYPSPWRTRPTGLLSMSVPSGLATASLARTSANSENPPWRNLPVTRVPSRAPSGPNPARNSSLPPRPTESTNFWLPVNAMSNGPRVSPSSLMMDGTPVRTRSVGPVVTDLGHGAAEPEAELAQGVRDARARTSAARLHHVERARRRERQVSRVVEARGHDIERRLRRRGRRRRGHGNHEGQRCGESRDPADTVRSGHGNPPIDPAEPPTPRFNPGNHPRQSTRTARRHSNSHLA